jgi:hypothetical protein
MVVHIKNIVPYILVETLDAYAADKHYFSKVKSILTKIREEYKIK